MDYLHFEKLDNNKKERIINSAMEVFSVYGFDKTSTNEIVKKAEISKGAIFKYFGNKENLFLYLFDYAESKIQNFIIDKTTLDSFDLFVRIESYIYNLYSLLDIYPVIMEFIKKAKIDSSIKIRKKIKTKKEITLNYHYDLILKGADLTLFKEDMDIEIVKFTIIATLEKLIYQNAPFFIVKEYLDKLKKLYYKN